MLTEWRDTLTEEVAAAEEAEQELYALLESKLSTLSSDQLADIGRLITKGSNLLNIVRFGNGVHNKKYAIMILDEAFGHFDDSIEAIENAE